MVLLQIIKSILESFDLPQEKRYSKKLSNTKYLMKYCLNAQCLLQNVSTSVCMTFCVAHQMPIRNFPAESFACERQLSGNLNKLKVFLIVVNNEVLDLLY